MGSLLLRWLFSALALLAVAYLYPGVRVDSSLADAVAALALGLVNALIRPILVLLTLPVTKSFWRWLVSRELDGIPAQGMWHIGHGRWGIENHVFNELTQHYHLEHCPHHEPTAIVAWRLILMLAFNLFEWSVRLHGKLLRGGTITLAELARQLDRALERQEDLEPIWSG